MNAHIPIVYLWPELPGYILAVLGELGKHTSGSIDVVHWDHRSVNSTQYQIGQSGRIQFHPRSRTSEEAIFDLLSQRQPAIIVLSGWMDGGYIRACKRYKRNHPSVRIVAGIDNQWTDSLRQKIGQIYYALFYRRLIDFVWISGKPQFSFVQRYGYGPERIISNLYSADTSTFNLTADFTRRFIFVGRFVKFKRLDLLVEAYSRLPTETQKYWPLLLIGDGDQRAMVFSKQNPNIQVSHYMQPHDLRCELLRGGVACLTSDNDHWGVVIHEYVLMGLPILLSSGCGAATEFLIPGYNGFLFKKGDVNSLHRKLEWFTKRSDNELRQFGINSFRLGTRISTELSARSLLSVIHLQL